MEAKGVKGKPVNAEFLIIQFRLSQRWSKCLVTIGTALRGEGYWFPELATFFLRHVMQRLIF